MTSADEGQGEILPDVIKSSDPYPSESPYMKKRKTPAALRFHKISYNADPKKYFFSECLLYSPFRKEEEIQKKIQGDLAHLEYDIQKVKGQVMEYLVYLVY